MPSIPADAEALAAPAVLHLERLGVSFHTRAGEVSAARDVTLSVARAECLAVVGESGAGKSQLFLAVLGLLAANGRAYGSARFADGLAEQELIGAAPAVLEHVRGAGIAMVFQDPMTSLTPHLTIGAQMTEVLRRHRRCGHAAAAAEARSLLERVHVSDAALRLEQYPHQLSGGMRQRVMIAIALSAAPRLLVLDEPTTALDVTIQAQILALLAELKRAGTLAMVLITHDLGAVAGVADRVAVMRAGEVVETGTVRAVLKSPHEPYTQALVREAATLATAPPGRTAPGRGGVALQVADLSVTYGVRRGWLASRARLPALSATSFELRAGESLGIVGESGAGKSTLARAVLQLVPASAGRIVWMGRALGELPPRELRPLRRELQIVFQDGLGSLDPRMTVGEILAEPLQVHEGRLDAAGRQRAIAAMLERVGLTTALSGRYPHELSGGQCQRVGIARAMILRPQLLVCDEPLSALDVSTQGQIVALLDALKREQSLSLLFVSHNLGVVRRLCDRVLVLYLGRMMEVAPTAMLDAHPRHPYSRELLATLPIPDPDLQPTRLARVLPGEPASPLSPPSGCVYRTRCPHALPVCAERVPQWEDLSGGHQVACHRWRELGGAPSSRWHAK
jgi:oligopeptide/dipeptide ABC transporter ATP-binding protein